MQYLLSTFAIAAALAATTQTQLIKAQETLAYELGACEQAHQERLRRSRNVQRTTPESLRMLENCKANARGRFERWQRRGQRSQAVDQ